LFDFIDIEQMVNQYGLQYLSQDSDIIINESSDSLTKAIVLKTKRNNTENNLSRNKKLKTGVSESRELLSIINQPFLSRTRLNQSQ
jgi:hypothetical protein